MSEFRCVARTALGLSHNNTLVLRLLGTVVVYLDEPGYAHDVEDSFRLVSDQGLYDRMLKRAEATRVDEIHTALRFTEVVPEGTYTLFHRLKTGPEQLLFAQVPFSVLDNHGDETEEPSNEDYELFALLPEPELVSGDPLLIHDAVDHSLDPKWYGTEARSATA